MAYNHIYDRLFPNQDTLPQGGFGNPIALPLQYHARQQGNTVFVDEQWVPYVDQWAFLDSLPRMSPEHVELLAQEASRYGGGTGLRLPVTNGEEKSTAPWMSLPSRRMPKPRFVEPLPERSKAVLAQLLYVEKAGLPSPLINAIKRLAVFQNPEF